MAKIFIIEDDRGWEQFYRRMLREFELEFFHDGVAAINQMEEPLPDVVILDILLNGPTGFAILNEMQSYPELKGLPVIIVSSVDLPEVDAEALASYGVVRCFDKSQMNPRELKRYIETLVEEDGDE